MERALEKLIEVVVDPQLKDLTLSVFEADSVDQRTICSEARTVPFLAERRLVVVRKAHRLVLRSKKAPIGLYLEHPCPTTCLVLIAAQMGERKRQGDRTEKLDRRSRLFSLAVQHGVAVSFPSLNRSEIINWMRKEVSRFGKTISPQAAAELQQLSGKNLSEVNNELQKAMAYVGANDRIEVGDVIAAVTDVHHETTYALADALADQDVVRALEVLENLIRDGEKPLGILWRIDWQFDRLYNARLMIDQGIKPQDVAGQLKVPSFYRKRFLGQVRKFTPERLRNLFHELVDTDLQLKSTGVDEKLLLEILIVKMCGGGKAIVQPARTA
jgi:DNA polymerase-3 subunit delta